jgi:hypothetical protein
MVNSVAFSSSIEYMGWAGRLSPKSLLKECSGAVAQPLYKTAAAALIDSNHKVQRRLISIFIKYIPSCLAAIQNDARPSFFIRGQHHFVHPSKLPM